MIDRSLAIISNKTRRSSLALRNDLRSSFRVERALEKNSLAIKSKLLEDRDRTLKALALRSTQKEKDKKGGVGGALGLLGGGALTRRFFGRPRGGFQVPKVPKVPTRGGAFLSRVGKFGRLGRVGPLAVLGTGIDFVGRKAEGQTNLQAGLGAGSGLAGALAGAKYGAILGTAVGGPVGTLVGGIGGSIIGGLAGGRLADFFSGADRRRKFEEQRVAISTQKTLFSSALDDLDRVLDKLESTPFFMAKKDDDDGLPERRFPFGSFIPKRFTPKPQTPLETALKQPAVQIIGYGALLLGAIALGGFTGEESIPAAGLLKAMSKTKMGSAIIKKIPALNKALKKVDILQPGKDIPGISAKGLQIRADAFLKKLNPKIKFDPKKLTKKQIEAKTLKDLLRQEKVLQEKLKKLTGSKTIDEATQKAISKFTERLVDITKRLEGMTIPDYTKTKRLPPGVESIFTRPRTNFNNLKVEAPTNDNDSTALALTNNIFINQDNSQKSSPPQIQGGDTIVIGGNSANSYDAAINIAQMEALQTV